VQLGAAVALVAILWCLIDASELVPRPLRYVPLLKSLSLLVLWRWGWAFLHWTRAAIYRYWAYPRLARAGRAAVALRGPVPEVAVLVATYKERPAITRRVILSVVDELAGLEGLRRAPLLIAVTGSDGDDEAITAALAEAAARLPASRLPELRLLRGANGKRDALAKGLEALAATSPDPEGAFVMMDGDTHLEPGVFLRCLPLLRLEPAVSAVTTNEHVSAEGPVWLSEWLHLRHGLRHLYTCSIALSNKLLCLTGRFSLFRASALRPDFIEIVRNDSVEHWLWGRYTLLSGDDKSTWFNLLSRGARLLYVPDATVVTHETLGGSSVVRAYHNLRRWGGNMVRNSERAIALGPRFLGLFCWWCLVDQRLSMWTTLVGPTSLLLALWAGRTDLAAAYVVWVIGTRTIRMIPSWLHGRRLSLLYPPLAAVMDWTGALVKIWVLFFPARQFWLNRGARELDSTRGRARIRDRKVIAASTLLVSLLLYVLGVGTMIGAIRLRGIWVLALSQPLAPASWPPALGAALCALVLVATSVWIVRRISPSVEEASR
jgi:glycosyltransferase Alg8